MPVINLEFVATSRHGQNTARPWRGTSLSFHLTLFSPLAFPLPRPPRPLDTRPILLPFKAVTRRRRKPPPSQSRLAVLILTESRHASSQTDASMKKWAELRKKEMEWILR